MANIVKAPVCCGRSLGQLFGRIAAGCGEAYFNGYFCDKCREGIAGTEVIVDFSDGEPIRDMTEEALRQFRATYAHAWWVTIINNDVTRIFDDSAPIESALRVALKAALKQPQPCAA